MGKQTPDITPQNLRNRGWAGFPQAQVRAWPRARRAPPSLGPDTRPPSTQETAARPQLGTNVGHKTSGASGPQRKPVRSCPEVLEMRQLYEHRPLGAAVADAVDARLKVRRRQRRLLGRPTRDGSGDP